jgi:hypothetical protein
MEPVSTSSFAAFLKFYGAAIMVTLAIALVATVVIMMRLPRSPQEWAVGLICTVVSSLTGGAFIIVKWGLHEWVTDIWGMIALGDSSLSAGYQVGLLFGGLLTSSINRRGRLLLKWLKNLKKPEKI